MVELKLKRAPRSSRRAGFSLGEVSVVLAFVSFFAVFMASALLTTNAVNNETYYESEVLQVANRLMNDLQQELSQAADYQAISGTAFTNFTFAHGQDADGNLALEAGVWDLRGQTSVWQLGFSYRTNFVVEGTLNENVARVDINGNGNNTDTAVTVGRLHLQLLDAGGSTISIGGGNIRERVFGGLGSRTRIVRDAFVGGTPVCMFSIPPPPPPASPVGHEGTAVLVGGGQPGQGDGAAVKVNMTIVRDPYPAAGGEKAIQIFRMSRVIARR